MPSKLGKADSTSICLLLFNFFSRYFKIYWHPWLHHWCGFFMLINKSKFLCYKLNLLEGNWKKKPIHLFNPNLSAVVFNTTFNNISVISWRKPVYPEKTTDLSQVTDRLYNIMLYQVNLASAGFKLTLVVIGTDCIGSCKSNYYTITTKTVPANKGNADKSIENKHTHLTLGNLLHLPSPCSSSSHRWKWWYTI